MLLCLDGGTRASAKIVDLDSEAQLFSEMWGWTIRIENLFSADYAPVPIQYLWKKMNTKRGGSFTLGSAYQSVLSNIKWINHGMDSPFFKQLQDAMKNDNIDSKKLSIRLNVDMYEKNSSESTFTIGRITGRAFVFPLFPLFPSVHRHQYHPSTFDIQSSTANISTTCTVYEVYVYKFTFIST